MSVSLAEEAAIVARAQEGDLDAFNQLVDRYQSVAYNLAYRLLGRADAAADVTQEAMLAAFRGIRSFRGGVFRSWLLRIVTNACYDELRRRQRQPATSLDDLLADPERAPAMPDPDAGPEEMAMRHDLQRRIAVVLLRLAPDFRAVIVLADVQGCSYDDIADILGVELGTVKSRLSRARAQMRELLRAEPELLAGARSLKSETGKGA